MSIHTLDPQFRVPGFFTQENINTISQLVTDTIAQSYTGKKVIVPDSHIVRFMQIVHEDRVESVAKMNQRVVLDLVRSFMNHASAQEKANNWANNRWEAYNWGPTLGIKQFETPRHTVEKVGRRPRGTGYFQFTY
jgi:hypothetical protein